MIPESFIESWRSHAKWQTLSMVEQDLIISHALVSLYNNPKIKDSLVFRGGTALHKLFVRPPARYSEDIDFVQTKAEPIGLTIEAIRASLNPWLGNPKWKLTERSAKVIYQYQTVNGLPGKLKVEINTTERLQVLPLRYEPFKIDSEWSSGSQLR
jgi:predicted nucleotidyltransferase component of viral defense system